MTLNNTFHELVRRCAGSWSEMRLRCSIAVVKVRRFGEKLCACGLALILHLLLARASKIAMKYKEFSSITYVPNRESPQETLQAISSFLPFNIINN